MEPVLSSPSPVSPLVDLLPLSLGPETLPLPYMGDEMTQLNNAETAQYTHTLTVTGRTKGLYRCSVFNSKPSSVAAELSVTGIAYSIYLLQHTTSKLLAPKFQRYLMFAVREYFF